MRELTDTEVSQIMMKGPVTLRPEDTLDVANDVIQLGRIRHIPIVDRGELLGILSQRDLFGAAANKIFGMIGQKQKELLRSIQIKEVMSKRVVTVDPKTTVRQAADLMASKKIGSLPVIEGEKLVGLVTQTDILRHVGKDAPEGVIAL